MIKAKATELEEYLKGYFNNKVEPTEEVEPVGLDDLNF